ncbi:unnamed protein product [Darwinula stevensoni]|uniref:Uncharacterized protein n=1 Tax=Darwinula stevensoni TaxID=69355 RepID=A0A7R9ACI0_9CRUS|nr:unnamed protein product [Darwinula stevensoni]CAG0900385.1 unnamed protein product [Darwinula stevensoni]
MTKQEPQQSLSNASSMEKKKATDVEEQLLRERSEHEETKRKQFEIEKKLEENRKQTRRSRAENGDDLVRFLREANKNKKDVIIIHIYSHTSMIVEEVEKMKRRIAREISHAIFLDADLDADWTGDYFWIDRTRSGYWIVVLTKTMNDWTSIDQLFAQCFAPTQFPHVAYSHILMFAHNRENTDKNLDLTGPERFMDPPPIGKPKRDIHLHMRLSFATQQTNEQSALYER